MEIFLDYAQRLGLQDKDGQPLVKWSTPEQAFEAFKQMTKGRPCDYTGLTYEQLRGGSGIQWPCNEEAPDGTERLYTDHVFPTGPDICEDYGHELASGATFTQTEFKALNPQGRAILKAAEWTEPHEWAREDYPFTLATGRTVYHFHTRTKTGRAPALDAAAPNVWVQLAEADAEPLGIGEGDMVEVRSRRGSVRGPARLGEIEPGSVFVPFHFGSADGRGDRRAANEMTITGWDPVSKQPYFKYSAVAVEKVE
jgi:anaerobic selenocysteine-containing dehydrogenase